MSCVRRLAKHGAFESKPNWACIASAESTPGAFRPRNICDKTRVLAMLNIQLQTIDRAIGSNI
jgi:hypothetical protein